MMVCMGNKAIKMKDSDGNIIYPCPYYPIGSIYMSINNINPVNFFGGTWEQIKDRFLLGVGDTYTDVNKVGGKATHTLTVEEMPSHSHGMTGNNGSGGNNVYPFVITDGGANWNSWNPTDKTGGGKSHNNMPPYLTVYIWKRVA